MDWEPGGGNMNLRLFLAQLTSCDWKILVAKRPPLVGVGRNELLDGR